MNHNKIIISLKLGVKWSLIIIFMFLFLIFLDLFSPTSVDISFNKYMSLIIIITSVLVVLAYTQQKNQIHAIEYDIEGISKKFLFFDYYSTLLPVFLITFGISVFVISIIYQKSLLVIFGFFTFEIGIISFVIINSIIQYDVGLNLSLDLSSMIFTKYIYKKEIIDPLFIKKFTYFFEKCLKNIDANLYKGIKISNLTAEDNHLSIRTIILYLSPYVKYGNEYERETLKNSLINMKEFITKDNKLKSLEITTCILDIYKSEKKFVLTHNYQIEPISPLIKLYEDVKNPLILSAMLFILITLITIRYFSITNSRLDFLQSSSIEILIQPITTILIAFLGAVVAIFKMMISPYMRK